MYRTVSILVGYGALELKRTYRKNLFTGMVIACMLPLAILGSMQAIGMFADTPVAIGAPFADTSKLNLGVPPMISRIDMPIRVAVPDYVQPKSLGIPTPVPDEQAINSDADIATSDDLKNIISSVPVFSWNDFDTQNFNSTNILDTLPKSDEFVPLDEAPEIIENCLPEYPELARRAGITGSVWINVLIDAEGKVRDVKIAKASESKAGFEEAAVTAAYKTVWKPAISNKQPVAVWVTYQIVFKLQ